MHLLDFDHLASMLPDAVAADLEPLRGVLAAHRGDERERMVRALRSARAKRALAGWSALVGGLADAPAATAPTPARPIAEVAGERIFRVHRRMVKMGRAIDDDARTRRCTTCARRARSCATCSSCSAASIRARSTKPMVRALKALQDVLGRFQDREVQADAAALAARRRRGGSKAAPPR